MKISAGILIYKIEDGILHVLLGHPGGPFFKNKDDAAWSILKGEIEEGEDPLHAAIREAKEEGDITVHEPYLLLLLIAQRLRLYVSQVLR